MNLFDKIMYVIFVHCVEGNLDFNNAFFNYTRNGLFTRLKKIHCMSHFKATLVGVTRSDGTNVGMVVFDTVNIVMKVLEDPSTVCNANISKGYNFWDGTHSQLHVYREFHTRDM